MDCYDEILKLFQDENETYKYIQYLADLINRKSKKLTELEFKNCLILTLAVRNPKFIDPYFSKGQNLNNLKKNKKESVIKLLKLEFRNSNS
ncbi:MAG: hypothetical protein ACFE9S_17445 [Candidatus Hermodarchaeota archaeon]